MILEIATYRNDKICDSKLLLEKFNDGTKKNKEKKDNPKLIKNLWNTFDQEFENDDEYTSNIKSKHRLVCVYSNTSDIDKTKIIKQEACTYCNSRLFIGDEGFLTCPNNNCGIIYKDNLDQSAEWRFYGADDNQNSDPTRCGMPINPLLRESSYSCKVLCAGKTSYEMHKIRRYTDWQSMPYKEKSQYDEFQLITVISQNAGIPKMIIDDAMHFHKQISEAKTFRGLNRDGIIAASIYVSCRVNNFPRTAKEIADIFNLDNTSATKGCKNALSIINEIEHNDTDNNVITLNKTTPLTFIERYCSKLNINSELTKLCKFIANKIEQNNLIPENTPHSIAGGIIYFVSQICNLNISKAMINNISKISEVTINKCYKKLELYKQDLVPNVIFKKYS
jgi:transcription initiation factor TFIIB